LYGFPSSYGFDTPEGVLVEEGKAYNPYFPNGSVLAMPQQLFDEGIEYKDGTTATMTQQAKDVATVSLGPAGATKWLTSFTVPVLGRRAVA
jgi:hypothetical protein